VRHGWIVLLLASAGCVDLKAPYPERRFYTLEPLQKESSRSAPDGTVLRVRRCTVSRAYEGSELVSRTGDAVYESDFYNAFFVPPATQITEQTHRWMGASKLFAHVVGGGSSVPETHTLEGHLIALYGDMRDHEKPAAVIEVQFMLVRVSSDPAVVVYQKSYREDIRLTNGKPEGFVKGWSDGLSNILTHLEADLSRAERAPSK